MLSFRIFKEVLVFETIICHPNANPLPWPSVSKRKNITKFSIASTFEELISWQKRSSVTWVWSDAFLSCQRDMILSKLNLKKSWANLPLLKLQMKSTNTADIWKFSNYLNFKDFKHHKWQKKQKLRLCI